MPGSVRAKILRIGSGRNPPPTRVPDASGLGDGSAKGMASHRTACCATRAPLCRLSHLLHLPVKRAARAPNAVGAGARFLPRPAPPSRLQRAQGCGLHPALRSSPKAGPPSKSKRAARRARPPPEAWPKEPKLSIFKRSPWGAQNRRPSPRTSGLGVASRRSLAPSLGRVTFWVTGHLSSHSSCFPDPPLSISPLRGR